MKKIKRILFIALVALLTVVLGVSATVDAAANDGKKQYIEDIVVAYGANYAEAKKKLDELGEKDGKKYYPVNDECSFNQLDGTTSDYVLVGYSITTNKQDAITDIATMNMLGDFNFDTEYDKILKEQKEEIHEKIQLMMPAFELFAENVENDNDNDEDSLAIVAYQMLDKLYNDDIIDSDTQKPVTVAKILTNIEDYTDEQLDDMFMQMSGLAFVTIQKYVFMGCIENWIQNLKQVPQNANYSAKDYEKAKIILQLMPDFQENIVKYKANGISYSSSAADIDNYLASLSSEDDKQYFLKYMTVDEATRQIKVNDTTSLYDLFMQDTTSEDAIKSLLPVAYSINDECSCLLGVTDLAEFFYLGCSAGNNASEFRSKINIDTVQECSVYAGVDRSLYNSDGIGVTNSATNAMDSTNQKLYDQYKKDKEQSVALKVSFYIAGIASFIIGTAFLVQGAITVYSAKRTAFLMTVSEAFRMEVMRDIAINGTHFFTGTVAGGAILIVLGIILIATFCTLLAFMIIKSAKVKEEEKKLRKIPRVMVDCVADDTGKNKLTFYFCVKDTDGQCADLNLIELDYKTENQWNALYYTKSADAGNPLTTDEIKVSHNSGEVLKTEAFLPIHSFGETSPYNVNSYNGSKTNIETYFGFSVSDTPKEDETINKTVPGATALVTLKEAIIGIGGLVLGAGIAVGIIEIIKKKKSNKNEV